MMLIYQDTDERHTALIAAVNNNDVKVASPLSSCLLPIAISNLDVNVLGG